MSKRGGEGQGLLPKALCFKLSFSQKLLFLLLFITAAIPTPGTKKDKGQGVDEALCFERLFTSCILTPWFLAVHWKVK